MPDADALFLLPSAVRCDPARLLEGSGKRMRHVKLRPGAEVDEPALRALIDAAYQDVRAKMK